ncbi:hypothetical protein AB0H20_17065 [Nocardia fluminea]|uniref:hypothetical protein n=1 Tax=Nocardia fluminea TaxID=134984 RepID=UPI0033E0E514
MGDNLGKHYSLCCGARTRPDRPNTHTTHAAPIVRHDRDLTTIAPPVIRHMCAATRSTGERRHYPVHPSPVPVRAADSGTLTFEQGSTASRREYEAEGYADSGKPVFTVNGPAT